MWHHAGIGDTRNDTGTQYRIVSKRSSEESAPLPFISTHEGDISTDVLQNVATEDVRRRHVVGDKPGNGQICLVGQQRRVCGLTAYAASSGNGDWPA